MVDVDVCVYFTSPSPCSVSGCFFFFNDTATTEIYTLSLHDALPIYRRAAHRGRGRPPGRPARGAGRRPGRRRRPVPRQRTDRKSTRLNSSHANISYAVFCLKKKKKNTNRNTSLTTQPSPNDRDLLDI